MAIPKKIPNPIDKYVGSRVRMRRMMLSMSQEVLADGLGITFQQVQKYEKGTNRVSASRMAQMAKILRVTPAFFFEGAPGVNGGSKADEDVALLTTFIATPNGMEMAKSFMAIKNTDLRRHIVGLAENIARGQR